MTEVNAEVMTDYQMRTIINLIIDVVREKRDPEKIIARLKAIRDGKDEEDDVKENV